MPETSHSFADDDWSTIINNVKNGNIGDYNVGDTKTIELDGYGTHTLRIANMSTPSKCNTSGFSQTACGFVLEFQDIITEHNMNDTDTNVGGWPSTSMRTFVNNDIYNTMSSAIKNAIIDTTVLSNLGKDDTENFTSTDKLYLLSTAELWSQGDYLATINTTRQLDYYKNLGTSELGNHSGAIKKKETSALRWWLRSDVSEIAGSFDMVNVDGVLLGGNSGVVRGVSPAFRLS